MQTYLAHSVPFRNYYHFTQNADVSGASLKAEPDKNRLDPPATLAQ